MSTGTTAVGTSVEALERAGQGTGGPAKVDRSPFPAASPVQRALGNHATGRFLQAKLKVTQADDEYEQEANRMADMVMRVPEPGVQRTCACGNLGTGEECEECRKKGEPGLQRRTVGGMGGPREAPPIILEALQYGGRPLDTQTRSFMEERFGRDFSTVRIYTDAHASSSAEAVNSLAYTVGQDIAFRAGSFEPSTEQGKHLLAHELTHTLQQNNRAEILPGTFHVDHKTVSDASGRGRAEVHSHQVSVQKKTAPSPKDDPARFEAVHENLFVRAPGGGSPASWTTAAADSVKKQFRDAIKTLKAKRPMAFGGEVVTLTTESEAKSDAVTMDKQLRAQFPIIATPLTEEKIRSRVEIIAESTFSSDEFLRQWLANRLYMWTDITNYAIKEQDADFQKVETDLLADAEVGPMIRKLASRQGAFTKGTGDSRQVFLHRGLSEMKRQATLIHELTHFYVSPLFVEWIDGTAAPRYYEEGFTEYLARKAMTPEQLKEGKAYEDQVKTIQSEVADYIPDDDIACAFFLGEVWRIEEKSKVARKTFKEQTGMNPDARREEEHRESREVGGINETVVPGVRYRFLNLGNESAEPKPEHVAVFRQINEKYIEKDPGARVRFVGHASSPGTLTFNDALSKQRSKAFYQMARDLGVPESQLVDAKSLPHFGETDPTAGNANVQGRAFNRRVEMSIVHDASTGGTTTPGPAETSGGEDYLHRSATGSSPIMYAPPIVDAVLRSPGKPLEANTRATMESRFGYDFSRVRIHVDSLAAQSAADVGARAYTVGSHVVLGAGERHVHGIGGRSLLAHELVHVMQQGHTHPVGRGVKWGGLHDPYEAEAYTRSVGVMAGERVAHPTLQTTTPRLQGSFFGTLGSVLGTIGEILATPFVALYRLLGGEFYRRETLEKYLADLRKRGTIEDNYDSDNKARACVSRENELGPYDVKIKTLLVEEMLKGATLWFDEASIIDLLRRTESNERRQIVTSVGRDRLWGDFSFKNRRVIEAITLTAADTVGDALLARFRKMTEDDLQDYIDNAADPDVKNLAQKASLLQHITAPVPDQAALSPQGGVTFQINGVTVIALPDTTSDERRLEERAVTAFGLVVDEMPGGTMDAANIVRSVTPPRMHATVQTTMGKGYSPGGTSGYGRGTTPEDQRAGNTSLRFHESRHGADWFEFLRTNPVPVFTGAVGMPLADFQRAQQQFETDVNSYNSRAAEYSVRMTDCPGTPATEAQLQAFGLTAAICREQ